MGVLIFLVLLAIAAVAVVAAVKANQGVDYRYPFNWRLVK